MSKYEVFSGPYFPAFGLNTDQKKNPHLDIFHVVAITKNIFALALSESPENLGLEHLMMLIEKK